VATDINGRWDVFVRDLQIGATTLVSVNNAGIDSGNDFSRTSVISANGSFVALTSGASDLVATDTNGGRDVFVFGPLIVLEVLVSHIISPPCLCVGTMLGYWVRVENTADTPQCFDYWSHVTTPKGKNHPLIRPYYFSTSSCSVPKNSILFLLLFCLKDKFPENPHEKFTAIDAEVIFRPRYKPHVSFAACARIINFTAMWAFREFHKSKDSI
jgi:hypothetical protein